MSLRPQRSGWCPINITVPIFTSFFICNWYKTMKSWLHWCQWQKLDTVGAGQVFAQRPQSISPGVTFVSVLSPGLTPSSKRISEFSKSSPWDRLVLSAQISLGCNRMHRNLLKPVHEGWARAGNKDWFLAPGLFLLVVCHDLLHLRNQNDLSSISQSDWHKRCHIVKYYKQQSWCQQGCSSVNLRWLAGHRALSHRWWPALQTEWWGEPALGCW